MRSTGDTLYNAMIHDPENWKVMGCLEKDKNQTLIHQNGLILKGIKHGKNWGIIYNKEFIGYLPIDPKYKKCFHNSISIAFQSQRSGKINRWVHALMGLIIDGRDDGIQNTVIRVSSSVDTVVWCEKNILKRHSIPQRLQHAVLENVGKQCIIQTFNHPHIDRISCVGVTALNIKLPQTAHQILQAQQDYWHAKNIHGF